MIPLPGLDLIAGLITFFRDAHPAILIAVLLLAVYIAYRLVSYLVHLVFAAIFFALLVVVAGWLGLLQPTIQMELTAAIFGVIFYAVYAAALLPLKAASWLFRRKKRAEPAAG